MQRREFSQSLAAALGAVPLVSAGNDSDELQKKVAKACDVLAAAVAGGHVQSATLHVRLREQRFSACFGDAKSPGHVSAGINLQAGLHDGIDDVV